MIYRILRMSKRKIPAGKKKNHNDPALNVTVDIRVYTDRPMSAYQLNNMVYKTLWKEHFEKIEEGSINDR